MYFNRKIIEVDYSISSWQELGTQAFIAIPVGMLLSLAVYLGVYYL